MKSFAKGLVVVSALIGASLTGIETAGAMTLAPVAPPSGSESTPIETVGWRCGPGWHVNPWGRCVPGGGGAYIYGRPGYGGGYGYRRPYARPYYGHPRAYGYHGGYHGGYRRW